MNSRIARISLLVFVFGLFVQTAHAVDKNQYRPYKHKYPQIIHETDYPTIEAIGNIVDELQALPKDKINCSYDNGVVSLQSGGDIADISTYDREVMVGERHYRERHTLVFFNTLIKMIGDLTKTGTCTVKYKQFSTHQYMTKTVIDFGFANQVVEVEAESNGPANNKRLYTLDLVKPKDSYYMKR